MTTMLRFARATVEQAGQVVVERVSLEVEAGQALALIGRDGSGTADLLEAAATAVRLHAGDIEVAGISILTNWAAGMQEQPLNHTEVVETGRAVTSDFARLIKAALGGGL